MGPRDVPAKRDRAIESHLTMLALEVPIAFRFLYASVPRGWWGWRGWCLCLGLFELQLGGVELVHHCVSGVETLLLALLSLVPSHNFSLKFSLVVVGSLTRNSKMLDVLRSLFCGFSLLHDE